MQANEKLYKALAAVAVFIGLNFLILYVLVINISLNLNKQILGASTSKSGEAKCSKSCVKYIDKAVKTNSSQYSTSSLKETFIPMGSGSSFPDEWTDVVGAQSYIDKDKYTNIKSVTLEAAVSNPNASQNVYVRLYNVTDKKAILSSELLTSGDGKIVSSGQVSLDSGNKLYQIQMKTQLRATANLVQARVKITSN